MNEVKKVSSPDRLVIVVFGASGDLTNRKVVPALYSLNSEDTPSKAIRASRSRTQRI